MIGITLTEQAAEHFQTMLSKKPEATGIVLKLKNSGCSEFSYLLDFTSKQDTEHAEFESHGVKIYVPYSFLPMLDGTVINCNKNDFEAVIKFENPNAIGSCGCGESFSLKK